MTLLNLLIAFLAGFLTFFAGCLFPLVPSYLAYLTGAGVTSKRKTFLVSLLFVTGFISVFIILGLTVNSLARFLAAYQPLIQKVGGAIIVLFGLQFLGFRQFSFFQRRFAFSLPEKVNPFLFGAIFGLSWTPCIGPVLAVILFWASQAATFSQGALFLFLFGMGLGLPFILTAIFLDSFFFRLKRLARPVFILQKVAAVFLILTGILLISGDFSLLSQYFLRRLGSAALLLELR